MTEEEKEHQENLEFILKYGVDITDYDPDDDPADEQLIPPDILKRCKRIDDLRRKEETHHKKLN